MGTRRGKNTGRTLLYPSGHLMMYCDFGSDAMDDSTGDFLHQRTMTEGTGLTVPFLLAGSHPHSTVHLTLIKRLQIAPALAACQSASHPTYPTQTTFLTNRYPPCLSLS